MATQLANIVFVDECKFVCSECDKVFSTKRGLTQHRWQVHTIGNGKWFPCDQSGCELKFKTNGGLKIHLWDIHTVGNGKWFPCDQPNCKFKCKRKAGLKQHLWQVHTVGNGKWFPCDQPNCKFKCKIECNIRNHLWEVHNIGNGDWFHCDQSGCEFKSKKKIGLKGHLWRKHSIGEEKWFKCNQCEYNCKAKYDLKCHLTSIHDIGDKPCLICLKNSYTSLKYTFNNTEYVSCRICYHKITGHKSKAEKTMVDHIRSDPDLAPYIVLADKILKGNLCKTKKRPDLLLSSSDNLKIILECDERGGHPGYNLSCEMSRMDELIDELGSNGRVVFIRWNPDYFKRDNIRTKVLRKTRLELLTTLIKHIITTPPTDDKLIMVYYMYYSQTNPVITNRHAKQLIYSEEDIPKN